MAAAAAAAGEEALAALYRWVDAVPLSRPKRNLARDFSDAVLAAELVKFHCPALVELHSYVPASSTRQKLANWGHLNRTALSKLGARVPEELLLQVAQGRPGRAEQLLLLLRERIEERRRRHRARPAAPQLRAAAGAGGGSAGARGLREPGSPAALGQGGRPDTGCSKGKSRVGAGPAPAAPRPGRGQRDAAQVAPGDTGDTAGAEQALLLAQETIQILRAKVRRLEQLLRLKDVRIEDLTLRLRQAERGAAPRRPHGPAAPP